MFTKTMILFYCPSKSGQRPDSTLCVDCIYCAQLSILLYTPQWIAHHRVWLPTEVSDSELCMTYIHQRWACLIFFSTHQCLGCPNFASKKVSFQSETKQNANGFAWFRFLFAKLWKKISLNFALFRFFSLKNMFCFKVSLREQFHFKFFA